MREPRYRVDIRVDETTTSLFTAGRVTNISRGGLFIETRSPLPIDADIDLELQLPDIRTVLSVHGRVAWTYDMKKGTTQLMTGSGIRFVDMTAEQRGVLESYIARLASPAPPRAAAAAP
jgi:uncharacterized protein (TIGR02266 family)